MTQHRAHSMPTKNFFVKMITKDISLEDCILDLIDNCLDGARKVKLATNMNTVISDYSGFYAEVSFNGNEFSIQDNCGGISISEAIDYAFHFGRRSDAPTDGEYSIGLYGIGMKRAIFKMGEKIDIFSSTPTEAFTTRIDVNEWLTRPPLILADNSSLEDWDFDMNDATIKTEAGTTIKITQLAPAVASQFDNSEFKNSLVRIIERDYSRFLEKGFRISINGVNAIGFNFLIKESADFMPSRISYTDDEIDVEIIAGMSSPPPDDLAPTERRKGTDYDGWYVSCNDRIVIAADKSDQTVWGNDFPVWHYQYNGFIGIVHFTQRALCVFLGKPQSAMSTKATWYTDVRLIK